MHQCHNSLKTKKKHEGPKHRQSSPSQQSTTNHELRKGYTTSHVGVLHYQCSWVGGGWIEGQYNINIFPVLPRLQSIFITTQSAASSLYSLSVCQPVSLKATTREQLIESSLNLTLWSVNKFCRHVAMLINIVQHRRRLYIKITCGARANR
jgi:hypothetical protein